MANEMKILGIFVVLGILIVGCFIVNIIDKSVRLENGGIVDKILIPKHHEEAIINSRRTFVPDRFYLILDGVRDGKRKVRLFEVGQKVYENDPVGKIIQSTQEFEIRFNPDNKTLELALKKGQIADDDGN
jgi:hypothetical protein